VNRAKEFVLLLSLAALWGCSSTVVVPVPPRVDLKGYGALGVVQFDSNAGPAIDVRATREFQARVHAAQPGTRLVELGPRDGVLAAVGARQFDAEALRRLGAKHGVDAVFLGEIEYSEPRTKVRIDDIKKLEGGVRTEVRGDAASRLVETRSGASVWSSTSWATRQVGRLEMSAEQGVSGRIESADPRELMVPALVYHLTHDFRPSTARQKVK
jgi:hypothetical protein